MTDDLRVYRATRSLRYGGGDRVDAGGLVVNPPEWVPDRLESHLERLDDEDVGGIPREELKQLHYNKLRHLAAEGPRDAVDGNSGTEEIIDAYAADSGTEDDETVDDVDE